MRGCLDDADCDGDSASTSASGPGPAEGEVLGLGCRCVPRDKTRSFDSAKSYMRLPPCLVCCTRAAPVHAHLWLHGTRGALSCCHGRPPSLHELTRHERGVTYACRLIRAAKY
jgi:hypothetical protein